MEHHSKKPRTYEHGAYFKSHDLFTKLLDLIETLPVDRLGNNGVYFQYDNKDEQFEKSVNIRKTLTCPSKLPKLFSTFSPKKTVSIQYASPKMKSNCKPKTERFALLEHSLKLKKKNLFKVNTTEYNSTCCPIKLVNCKKYYLKTEFDEKKASSSQKTLTNVIQLLQRGKNKYLTSDFVM